MIWTNEGEFIKKIVCHNNYVWNISWFARILKWTKENHKYFQEKFKKQIECVLLCNLQTHKTKNSFQIIPKDVLMIIFYFLGEVTFY